MRLFDRWMELRKGEERIRESGAMKHGIADEPQIRVEPPPPAWCANGCQPEMDLSLTELHVISSIAVVVCHPRACQLVMLALSVCSMESERRKKLHTLLSTAFASIICVGWMLVKLADLRDLSVHWCLCDFFFAHCVHIVQYQQATSPLCVSNGPLCVSNIKHNGLVENIPRSTAPLCVSKNN